MLSVASASRPAPLPPQVDDPPLLHASLEALAGKEEELTERFYPLFFARHPEVQPLFGEHGVSEREEMIRETLASVLAHADDEPWLDGNLEAMGRSHAEYGVEGWMYEAFLACMLDVLEDTLGAAWSEPCDQAWSRALERLTRVMHRAARHR